jgi:hypothetical protein
MAHAHFESFDSILRTVCFNSKFYCLNFLFSSLSDAFYSFKLATIGLYSICSSMVTDSLNILTECLKLMLRSEIVLLKILMLAD